MGHQGDWQVAVNNHSQMNNLGKVARDTRNQGWQVGRRVWTTGILSYQSNVAWSPRQLNKSEVSNCFGVVTGNSASPEFQATKGSERLRLSTVGEVWWVSSGSKRSGRAKHVHEQAGDERGQTEALSSRNRQAGD